DRPCPGRDSRTASSAKTGLDSRRPVLAAGTAAGRRRLGRAGQRRGRDLGRPGRRHRHRPLRYLPALAVRRRPASSVAGDSRAAPGVGLIGRRRLGRIRCGDAGLVPQSAGRSGLDRRFQRRGAGRGGGHRLARQPVRGAGRRVRCLFIAGRGHRRRFWGQLVGVPAGRQRRPAGRGLAAVVRHRHQRDGRLSHRLAGLSGRRRPVAQLDLLEPGQPERRRLGRRRHRRAVFTRQSAAVAVAGRCLERLAARRSRSRPSGFSGGTHQNRRGGLGRARRRRGGGLVRCDRLRRPGGAASIAAGVWAGPPLAVAFICATRRLAADRFRLPGPQLGGAGRNPNRHRHRPARQSVFSVAAVPPKIDGPL
ncbi:ABC transporter, permease protein (cluster 8, B12/iron complex), partial [Methylomonas fluvii]